MKQFKFLQRAVGNGKPHSWGYVVEHEGKPVIAVTDGYRAHYLWNSTYEPGTLIPFENSIPGGASTEYATKLQNFLVEATAIEYECELVFTGRALANTLRDSAFESLVIVVAGSTVLLVGERSIHNIPADVVKVPAEPLYIPITERYLCEAVWKKSSALRLRAGTDPNQWHFTGSPGQYASIIMPRNYIGRSDVARKELKQGTELIRKATQFLVEQALLTQAEPAQG